MKTSDSMTARAQEYLRYRRALGYGLQAEGGMLLNFARYADGAGHRGALTRELALRWARLPAEADRLYWARRIEVLIGFARYCRIFDARTQMPPRHVFGPAHRRNTPYIYSAAQLRVLAACRGRERDICKRLRELTRATAFGLLACTGLRIGEALALRVADVDFKQRLITVRESKRHRCRLVPLHPTVMPPLRRYAAVRQQCFPGAQFFFVNHSGNRLSYTTIRIAFRKLTLQLGWGRDGRLPRLHDLRHTFACQVLLKWHRRRPGKEDRIDWLSRYLGHKRVSNTYWYFTGTPQLFAATAARFGCPTSASCEPNP